ncbi:hypothetical protein IW261DRAFT_1684760 [Armillaria novae-zelandiae]|uniref:Uncharacterized protein n=1 Tax=Armillaria novae-zelandiae TaxID=153914 RepID=A0AA39TCV8_9AGAR|nr:hypothetical protein IW261DRAFT_1684760 [Armillaria novae-zelandiae]
MHKFSQLLSSVASEPPLPYPSPTGPSHWNWNFVPRSTLASASSLSATLAPDNLWNESLNDDIIPPTTHAFESFSSSPSPKPRPVSKPKSKSRIRRPKSLESVKEEPGSPRFIIEPLLDTKRCLPSPEHSHSPTQLFGRSPLSQPFAPPTQVPLRATQANDDMRSMMGVFRLDPFTVPGGNPSPALTWSGEEPGPLESMPVLLPEWQIPGYDGGIFNPGLPELTCADIDGLERLSPTFDVAGVKRNRDDYEEGDDHDERQSQRYKLTAAVFTSESPSAEYSRAESLVYPSPSLSPIPMAEPPSVTAHTPAQISYNLKQEIDFDNWGRRYFRDPSYKLGSSSSLVGFMGDGIPPRAAAAPQSRKFLSDSSLIPPLSNAYMESAVNDQSNGIAPMLSQPSQALVNSSTARNINARKDPPHPEFPTTYQQQWEQEQDPVARSSPSSRSSVSSGTPPLTYDMTSSGSAPYMTLASNYNSYTGDSSAPGPSYEPSYTVDSYSDTTSDTNQSTMSMRRMPYHLPSPFPNIGMGMVSHVRGSAASATFYGQ